MNTRGSIHGLSRALLLAALTTDCAASGSGSSIPGSGITEPIVLVATSDAACEDGNHLDLSDALVQDGKTLETIFPKPHVVDLRQISTLDLRADSRGRPLVLVYSGHGIAVREGERETTHLCLPGPTLLSTDALFEWIRAQEPKWATVILNGCETAQVNPAVVAAPPISVLSASPSVVSPSSLPNRNGTDFVWELAALVTHATAGDSLTPDINCDGVLTDRELFYPLETQLRKLEWQRTKATALPVPKLRRNAAVPLPLLYLERRACQEEPVESTKRLPELARWLEDEREALATGALPGTRKAWFILNGVRDHRACLSGSSAGAVDVVCRELQTVLEPVPLGASDQALDDASLLKAAKTLAQRSAGAELYWLALDADWAELIRLRDGGVVGVAKTENIRELVPRDERKLLSSVQAGETWRFSGRVSWANLSAQAAIPTVCRAPEGQCFRFPEPPVLSASVREGAP